MVRFPTPKEVDYYREAEDRRHEEQLTQFLVDFQAREAKRRVEDLERIRTTLVEAMRRGKTHIPLGDILYVSNLETVERELQEAGWSLFMFGGSASLTKIDENSNTR